MSMKRRMSDPDCKEFYDDAPLFLGSNPRGQTQLSLEDVWVIIDLTRPARKGHGSGHGIRRVGKLASRRRPLNAPQALTWREASPSLNQIRPARSTLGRRVTPHSSLSKRSTPSADPSLWLEPLKSVLIQPEIISLHQQLGPKYLGYDYKLGEKSPLPQAETTYHSDQIHGLAFSQPTECTHLSGVIGCIHRALENQYPDKFTTRRDNGTAHAKFGWREFTAKILEIVSRDGGSIYNDSSQPASHTVQKGIVFIGWGDEAIQAIESAGIASSSRQHQILTSRGAPYPSSAYKDGFFGKNHFIQANEFLRTTYGDTIDWWNLQSLDP
ncbi:hypothetical protein KEM48_010574 [Puccinia striiformis f. sp. tritici PST-130]|nr:hypothetical protein KEM48_010574 [Puccinia striiformis f. sp. tritici PST-130]